MNKIDQKEYKLRRQNLFNHMDENSLLIVSEQLKKYEIMMYIMNFDKILIFGI